MCGVSGVSIVVIVVGVVVIGGVGLVVLCGDVNVVGGAGVGGVLRWLVDGVRVVDDVLGEVREAALVVGGGWCCVVVCCVGGGGN